MNPTPLRLLILPLAFLFALTLSQAEEKLLPPTYIPGKEYVMEQQQKMEMDMAAVGAATGMPMGKTVMDMTFDMKMRCTKHTEPGQKVVSSTITGVKMDMNAMGMQMTYDSSQPGSENTMLGQQMSALVGAEFSMIMDQDDNVLEVQGMDKLMEGNPQAQKMMDVSQMKALMNPAAIMGIDGNGRAKGESWENEHALPMGQMGTMDASYKMTYAKDETVDSAPCAVVDYTADLEGEVNAGAPGMNMTLTDSKMSGTMAIDKELRFARSSKADVSMKMSMTNPQNPAQSLAVPMSMKQTYTLKAVNDIE